MHWFFWHLPITRLSPAARITIGVICLLSSACMVMIVIVGAGPSGLCRLPALLIIGFPLLCSLACVGGRIGSISGRIVAGITSLLMVAFLASEAQKVLPS